MNAVPTHQDHAPAGRHDRRRPTGQDDAPGRDRARPDAAGAGRRPDDPAAQVTPDVVIGAHTDLDALRRRGRGCRRADVRPRARADRAAGEAGRRGRERGAAAGGADPRPGQVGDAAAAGGARARRFRGIAEVTDVGRRRRVRRASVGGPLVVKTVRGGYDGRGVLLARDLAEAREFAGRYLADGVPVLVEERVAMRRELSALVARSPFGQGAAWPVVETVQRDGICVEVIAPAPGLDRRAGQRGRAAGAAAGRRTGRGRRAGGRVVRDRRRRAAGQRAGDATAQLRSLDHGRRRSPVSSSSTCARCWTIRSATPRPDRAGDGDGQCAWAPRRHPR